MAVIIGSRRFVIKLALEGSVTEPHDFGALQTESRHQTLLVESEGVDAAVHGAGGEAARHSFIHDDDAWARADLPTLGGVDPIHRLLVHEEECVTVFLD